MTGLGFSAIEVEPTVSSEYAVSPAHTEFTFPSTDQLLVEGGDDRLALDPGRGANRYGCRPVPDTDLAAFGSSTASVISEAGFSAADRLRQRLSHAAKGEHDAVTYGRELDRIRRELVRLCGVADVPAPEVVLAASGTDLHLIAAQLTRGGKFVPTLVIMMDAAETGTYVPAALAGHHFGSRSALGDAVAKGTSIGGGGTMELVSVPIRLADGTPRQAAAVDAEVESLVEGAAAAGRRVLLILVDISKTGLIAPSPACVLALRRRLPDVVDVFVDACQFRIAPSTLRAYLQHDFMVALTGSKFVTGPTFAGALLIPSSVAQRLRGRPLPRALAGYSSRSDWPESWDAAQVLDNRTNFGLLLRWEAALEELRAFRSVPEEEVAGFLQAFALAVQNRLMSNPVFEPLPASNLDRRPLTEAASWDRIPTIFPFLLHGPKPHGGRAPLNREETSRIYHLLQLDLAADGNGFDIGDTVSIGDVSALRCQLGQPVACGIRDGMPVSALRLCASARLVVEATSQKGQRAAALIERAVAALDKTALLVRQRRIENG